MILDNKDFDFEKVNLIFYTILSKTIKVHN
jgi:hypothetical protein